ncbi:MAG: hypothetical protein M0Z66_16115 [Thermaerobacter sp.]|nr:hypothetical protein [Thermaerobacter sp.]
MARRPTDMQMYLLRRAASAENGLFVERYAGRTVLALRRAGLLTVESEGIFGCRVSITPAGRDALAKEG